MYLFASIALVCMALNFSREIVKFLQIARLLSYVFCDSPAMTGVTPELQQELEQARANLERVKASPAASGEYAQLVKTMRAEQRIKDLEDRMRNVRTLGRLKGVSIDLIGGWALKAVLSLVLLYFTLRYRYTPVLIFSDRFNFTPLEGMMSFPTGVPNAVSVPCWVVSCNVTFRLISSLIKRKK